MMNLTTSHRDHGPKPQQRRTGVSPALAAKRPSNDAPSALGRRDACPTARAVLCAAFLAALAACASAALPPAAAIQRLADDYIARRMTPAFPQGLSVEEASEVRDLFLKKLEPPLGRPAATKVGLVSRPVKDGWEVDLPGHGGLPESLCFPDNAD